MAVRRPLVSLAFALVVIVTGCADSSVSVGTTVNRWMTCFECDAELAALLALAQQHPQDVIDSLAPRVLASPIVPLGYGTALQEAYLRDSLYRITHGMPASSLNRAQYVASRERRFIDGQRARAGLGLGHLHRPAAVAVLNQALTQSLSPELRRALLYARDSLP
jgi:hypothetical protein